EHGLSSADFASMPRGPTAAQRVERGVRATGGPVEEIARAGLEGAEQELVDVGGVVEEGEGIGASGAQTHRAVAARDEQQLDAVEELFGARGLEGEERHGSLVERLQRAVRQLKGVPDRRIGQQEALEELPTQTEGPRLRPRI